MSEDLNQIEQDRREKLDKIIELGVNPFPYNYNVDSTTIDIINNFLADKVVSISGRIMSLRKAGKKAAFLNIQDSNGRIQLYVNQNNLTELEYNVFNLLDIGDIIGYW